MVTLFGHQIIRRTLNEDGTLTIVSTYNQGYTYGNGMNPP